MKKIIKALLADIDGTLVERGKQMNQVTTDALNRLHEEGVLIGIASGRPVNDQMRAKAQEWNLNFEFDALIGMNGGQLWDRNHDGLTEMFPLSEETLRVITERMSVLKKNAFAYEGDHLLAMELTSLIQDSANRNEMRVEVTGYEDTSAFCAHSRNKILYRMPVEEVQDVLAYLNSFEKDDRFTYFMTGPGILEFQDPRVNKGTALLLFAERNGILPEEIAALGDEQNDYEMIREAGLGVCMCNGCEQCREAADAITEYSASEGGAGRWIFDHLLKKG